MDALQRILGRNMLNSLLIGKKNSAYFPDKRHPKDSPRLLAKQVPLRDRPSPPQSNLIQRQNQVLKVILEAADALFRKPPIQKTLA